MVQHQSVPSDLCAGRKQFYIELFLNGVPGAVSLEVGAGDFGALAQMLREEKSAAYDPQQQLISTAPQLVGEGEP